MKKTIISILALCQTVALANAEVGIKTNTKTSDFKNFSGVVEVFGKYDSEKVKAEAKSHLINYKNNVVENVVVKDYYAKVDADLLKSDINELSLGAFITKSEADDYKIEDGKNKAGAYLNYTNKQVKNWGFTSKTKVVAGLNGTNYIFKSPTFTQELIANYKLRNFENETGLKYTLERDDTYYEKHSLFAHNKALIKIRGIEASLDVKLASNHLSEVNFRNYKPGLDLEVSGKLGKETTLKGKLDTLFSVAESDASKFKNETGLNFEYAGEYQFGKTSFKPTFYNRFQMNFDNSKTIKLDSVQDVIKVGLPLEYKGDVLKVKVEPSAEAHIKYNLNENDSASTYKKGFVQIRKSNGDPIDLLKAELNIETEIKAAEMLDFMLKNKTTLKLDDATNLNLGLEDTIELSAKLHKEEKEKGFKIALIPSLKMVINQNWLKGARQDMLYKIELKNGSTSEYEIKGTPFFAVTPKVELKLEKELSKGLMLDFGSYASRTFNYVTENGKLIAPSLENVHSMHNLDTATKDSPYEIGASIGLTYKF